MQDLAITRVSRSDRREYERIERGGRDEPVERDRRARETVIPVFQVGERGWFQGYHFRGSGVSGDRDELFLRRRAVGRTT